MLAAVQFLLRQLPPPRCPEAIILSAVCVAQQRFLSSLRCHSQSAAKDATTLRNRGTEKRETKEHFRSLFQYQYAAQIKP